MLHICNTFFDLELEKESMPPLEEAFALREIFLQLQFLPFLYGKGADHVFTSFLPVIPPHTTIETWGHSPTIAKWAKKNGLSYQMPPWQVVKMVHSKAFSFNACPLPGGKLLHHADELYEWLGLLKGKGVLKSCFGAAGRGHRIFDAFDPSALRFAEKEWQQKRPVVGEPWMARLIDFSTQWHIGKTIRYLGATICGSDAQGRYCYTQVGEPVRLLQEEIAAQKKAAAPILAQIALLGYFGNIGFDAMVYEDAYGKKQLHPVVEINARKTMGWATLAIAKKHFSGKNVQLAFTKNKEAGILPVAGAKNLEITII